MLRLLRVQMRCVELVTARQESLLTEAELAWLGHLSVAALHDEGAVFVALRLQLDLVALRAALVKRICHSFFGVLKAVGRLVSTSHLQFTLV